MKAACWVINSVVWMVNSPAERMVAQTVGDSGAKWEISTVAETDEHLETLLVEMREIRSAYVSVVRTVDLMVEKTDAMTAVYSVVSLVYVLVEWTVLYSA